MKFLEAGKMPGSVKRIGKSIVSNLVILYLTGTSQNQKQFHHKDARTQRKNSFFLIFSQKKSFVFFVPSW
jgi:hypothetical protein